MSGVPRPDTDRFPDLRATMFMTQADVAALFRVSDRTVRNWVRRGLILRIRFDDGKPGYYRAEIRALLGKASS